MPNRFTPINNQASLSKSMQTINKNFMMLDAETYSKTIQKGGQTQMVSGKFPNGRYGELFYDENGVPRILIGQAAQNGRPGIWITKPGFNVLDEVK